MVLIVFDCVHVDGRGLVFVLFNSVLREEGLIGVVNSEPGLIFVRKQFANIFWSCGLKDLSKQKFVVCFNRIVRILSKSILLVVGSWKLGRAIRFDPVGGVIFMEDVE